MFEGDDKQGLFTLNIELVVGLMWNSDPLCSVNRL